MWLKYLSMGLLYIKFPYEIDIYRGSESVKQKVP